MAATVSPPAALFDVAGKSALISGATGTLGTTAALALARAGAKLTLAEVEDDLVERVAGQAREAGATVATVHARPDSEHAAESMVAAAVDRHGALDLVLVANGINEVDAIQDLSTERWQRVMDVHVKGAWWVCKAAARRMIAQGRGGKVVLVSSTRGRLGHPAGYSAYCTAKSAIDGLVRALACEWGPHRITINAIGPTVFRSPLSNWMFAEEDPGRSVREQMLKRIPLGRLGEPQDLVGPLLFLLSPASDFVTGQVLYADGGYTAG